MTAELNIAEIPYESGQIRFRYSRYLSSDGTRWIQHGLFRAYHLNGALASEGTYLDGAEHGPWRDFHDNGQLAAEGQYETGTEVGTWRYWNAEGTEETGMDETNPAIAAQRTLFALSPDGVGSDLVLTISVPTASEFGSTCKVAIGFIDPSLTLHGVDAWQAIHLSMRFIASRVGHFEEEGWKFYWEEGGDQMHAADLAIETKQDTAEAKAEYEASTEEVPFTPEQEEMLRQIALKSAPEALQKLENAHSDDDVFTYLPRAAAAAFHLERFDDAQRLAERCLALAPANQENWNYGNALHAAHTVLGLLALRLGDLADACNELLQSGDTPGSPQLGSFGPTMQLAKALLRQGQTAPVLAYLEKCRVFWKMGGSMLDLWEDKIKSDQVPNFFQHTHV